ncbi:alpha/beta hydrolase [bacterium]|nr:MAG: alpha/beta hydrolase [bacterium]
MIGYEAWGSGEQRVVILNDWLCDTSTWDDARAYLDIEQFTWAFADLRGYGRSKQLTGHFTLEEAAADVLALVDALGWQQFSIIGHSMSSLIALHLGQQHSDRIERAVVITPPPPRSFGADEASLEAMRAMASGDEETRMAGLQANWGDYLSPGWLRFKIRRWRECASPEAATAYVDMFGRDGMPDPVTPIEHPVLAITGEKDAPPMRSVAVRELLGTLCPQLQVIPIVEAGHYPMQEAPPLTVAILERFLV